MPISNKNAGDNGQDEVRRGDAKFFKLLQFTVETSADAIFWITPEGCFFHVNKAACEELGYTREELQSLCVWDIDPLYTKDKWPETWRETQRRRTLKFETLHRTKTGRLIPVEIIANYMKYDDTEYSCAFSRDITDRKRSEEALRESEAKFRAIFDGTFQFLGLLTVDGTLLDVNKAALDAVAIPKFEVIGKPFWETPWCTFTSEISKKIRDSIVRARNGEFVRFETVIRVADGGLRNIDYSIKPMFDEAGRIILLIPEGRDITYLKQVETALRESEEKFRVLAETSAAAIFVYQGERVVSVNKAAESITGFSRDELLKMKYWEIVHPDFREIVKEYSFARQRGEPAPSRYEFEIRTKGGEDRWVEITAGRIMYKGKPAGVATLFDITERKRAEEELEEAKNSAELYLDLMSHDINNMNQVALGYLELADNVIETGGKLGKENRELIEKPITSLKNSSGLIDKVMKLRRLKAKELRLSQVDVCSVLSEIKARYSHMAGRDVTINYVSPQECLVMANELIDEIFINLIENSLKHSPHDKPLVIGVIQATVCEEGKEFIRISVEDNGPGIPDKVKEKLFARYYRGKTRAKGKGLGLYLVKTLVEDFQGKIWVEDRVQGDHTKGARFVVMLPAVEK